MTGHHRKHGIRLLGQLDDDEDTPRPARGRRVYDEAVREAVIVIWEAADRIYRVVEAWKAIDSGVTSLGGVYGAPWPPRS